MSPHDVQRWMSSCPSPGALEEEGVVPGDRRAGPPGRLPGRRGAPMARTRRRGRAMSAAARHGRSRRQRRGRKRRMRKRMVATSSPCWSVKSRRVVTKWPSPRPVRLLGRHRLDHRRRGQPVAEHERPCVLLVAVGGHHRGEAGRVEQRRRARSWAVGASASARSDGQRAPRRRGGPVAAHDPGLEHRRRGHHPGEAVGPGRRRRRRRPGSRRPSPRPSGGSWPGSPRRRRRRGPEGWPELRQLLEEIAVIASSARAARTGRRLTGPPASCRGPPWPRSRAGPRSRRRRTC